MPHRKPIHGNSFPVNLLLTLNFWIFPHDALCECASSRAKDRIRKKNFLSRARAQLTMMITTNKRCKTVQHQHGNTSYVFIHAACMWLCMVSAYRFWLYAIYFVRNDVEDGINAPICAIDVVCCSSFAFVCASTTWSPPHIFLFRTRAAIFLRISHKRRRKKKCIFKKYDTYASSAITWKTMKWRRRDERREIRRKKKEIDDDFNLHKKLIRKREAKRFKRCLFSLYK